MRKCASHIPPMQTFSSQGIEIQFVESFKDYLFNKADQTPFKDQLLHINFLCDEFCKILAFPREQTKLYCGPDDLLGFAQDQAIYINIALQKIPYWTLQPT